MKSSISQSWDGKRTFPRHGKSYRIQSKIDITRLSFSSYDQVPEGFQTLDSFLEEVISPNEETEFVDARKHFANERVSRRGYQTLADLRLLAGYTQIQFAELIGTSQPRLSSWEAGAERPSFDSIIKIASALKVDFDTLMMAILNVKS